ncbi:MAG: hypothetical protein AAGE43_14530 [Pseudomonadota bacterium]
MSDSSRQGKATKKTRAKAKKGARPAPARPRAEPDSQVTIKMRASLHQELAAKAFTSGMTMRGFIMSALKQAGLKVTEDDLVDRRRRSSR